MTLYDRTSTALATLDPQWWAETRNRHGQGLTFSCPHCRAFRIAVAFSNPLDGGAPATMAARMAWFRQGETFETISIIPGINAVRSGHGRGALIEGEVLWS